MRRITQAHTNKQHKEKRDNKKKERKNSNESIKTSINIA